MTLDKILQVAGAYDGKFMLNLWRGAKISLAPKDIATIGCYLGGQTDIIASPKMWGPLPELF